MYKKRVFYFVSIILIIFLNNSCEERPRTNPFDSQTELDPTEWAPKNLQAQVLNDSEIKLSWEQEEKQISGFRLERRTGEDDWILIADVAKINYQYIDTGLSLIINYAYRISAYTPNNQSDYSISNVTSTSFPSPSNLQTVAINDGEIQLMWVDNCTFEDGFRIERQDNSGTWLQVGEVTSDVTQFTDTGLNYGTIYTYRVAAYSTYNQSSYATSNTTNTSFPAPTNLTAAAQNDSDILLEWTDNCDFESGFRIERRDYGGSWVQVGEVTMDIIQFSDSGLIYGTDYTYRLYAFTNSNQSNYATSNTTSTRIPAPTNLMATIQNDTDVLLGWTDNCGFENGFRIERQDNGGTWVIVGEVNADITQYSDTGLNTASNTYNYRNYAYTANNVSEYSNSVEAGELTVTDIDGNVYQTIVIGTQTWMAENLKVTHYRNGQAIPNVTNASDWGNLSTGSYCNLNNDANNSNTYGTLYNWYAADDSRNIAPEGWHMPSDAEWQTLVDFLGGSIVAGGKMKEIGITHWNSPNTGATNESGFTALPGGYRYEDGSFSSLGSYAFFWSSTENSSSSAWYQFLYYFYSEVQRGNNEKRYGFSVRCVRD